MAWAKQKEEGAILPPQNFLRRCFHKTESIAQKVGFAFLQNLQLRHQHLHITPSVMAQGDGGTVGEDLRKGFAIEVAAAAQKNTFAIKTPALPTLIGNGPIACRSGFDLDIAQVGHTQAFGLVWKGKCAELQEKSPRFIDTLAISRKDLQLAKNAASDFAGGFNACTNTVRETERSFRELYHERKRGQRNRIDRRIHERAAERQQVLQVDGVFLTVAIVDHVVRGAKLTHQREILHAALGKTLQRTDSGAVNEGTHISRRRGRRKSHRRSPHF